MWVSTTLIVSLMAISIHSAVTIAVAVLSMHDAFLRLAMAVGGQISATTRFALWEAPKLMSELDTKEPQV